MKYGILLGRFRPLHAGHLALMEQIIKETRGLIVVIGSAQEKNHPTAQWMTEQLGKVFESYKFKVIEMNDPADMSTWPETLHEAVQSLHLNHSDEYGYLLYRSDCDVDMVCCKRLNELGIDLLEVERKPFFFLAPDGFFYRVSSATRIRELYKFIQGINL